jgi:uncharacterized protein DUF3306
MSEEEFLKRWSRRKQEAKVAEQAPPSPVAETVTPPIEAETASEPEIDLSKLPSIDSITAATDITEFLRKGIPAELSRAALRRAWAADPVIRDFVGLAENAWDFTDPDAIPGFGALQSTPEQIGAMVERVIGGVRETAEKLASELPEKEQVQQKRDQEPAVSAPAEAVEEPAGAASSTGAQAEPVAAAQPEASDEDGDDMPVRRRTHGGALPG